MNSQRIHFWKIQIFGENPPNILTVHEAPNLLHPNASEISQGQIWETDRCCLWPHDTEVVFKKGNWSQIGAKITCMWGWIHLFYKPQIGGYHGSTASKDQSP